MNEEYTTGEAEAWREGFKAAQEAAAKHVAKLSLWFRECEMENISDSLDDVKDAIRAMQPPERPE